MVGQNIGGYYEGMLPVLDPRNGPWTNKSFSPAEQLRGTNYNPGIDGGTFPPPQPIEASPNKGTNYNPGSGIKTPVEASPNKGTNYNPGSGIKTPVEASPNKGTNYNPGVDGGTSPTETQAPAPEPGSKENPLPGTYSSVANAKPGQWVKNSKGLVQLKQADITYAQNALNPPSATKEEKPAPAPEPAPQQKSYAEAHPEVGNHNQLVLQVLALRYRAEYNKYNAMSDDELNNLINQMSQRSK